MRKNPLESSDVKAKALSRVRDLCRDAFEARIPVLCEIVDSPEPSVTERIRAVDTLAKYGLSQKVEISLANEDVVQAVAALLPAYLDEESALRFIDDLTESIKGFSG
jgi:hypothetical protein